MCLQYHLLLYLHHLMHQINSFNSSLGCLGYFLFRSSFIELLFKGICQSIYINPCIRFLCQIISIYVSITYLNYMYKDTLMIIKIWCFKMYYFASCKLQVIVFVISELTLAPMVSILTLLVNIYTPLVIFINQK